MKKLYKRYMNKRGQVVAEVIFATFIIGITLFGVYKTISEGSKIYVGDKSENIYYEYYKCEDSIKTILEENIIVFNSKGEANNAGYKPKEGYV